jgi:hypothetical protein
MADGSSAPADGAAVTWRYDNTTEAWLRWLSTAAAAAVFGTYGALVLAALSILVLSAAAGNVELLLLVGLLALLGSPVSLLYLWPLRDPDQRPTPSRDGTLWSFSPREVLALVACGVLVAILAFLIDPRLPFGLFLTGLAALVVVSGLSTEGRVDTQSRTVEVRGREIDVADVEAVHTYDLGPVVAVRRDRVVPEVFRGTSSSPRGTPRRWSTPSSPVSRRRPTRRSAANGTGQFRSSRPSSPPVPPAVEMSTLPSPNCAPSAPWE